jgi:hypothetical protein
MKPIKLVLFVLSFCFCSLAIAQPGEYHTKSFVLKNGMTAKREYALIMVLDKNDSVVCYDKVRISLTKKRLTRGDFKNEPSGKHLFQQVSKNEDIKEVFYKEVKSLKAQLACNTSKKQ